MGWNWSNSVTTEWRHNDKSITNIGSQELRLLLKFK
jgi:hypothetical protein